MEAPHSPSPFRSIWKFQDKNYWLRRMYDAFPPPKTVEGACSCSSIWTIRVAAKLYKHIESLGFMVPLLRQICSQILVHEEGQQEVASTVILRLKEDLSGFPTTLDETECWIWAQFISYGTNRGEQFCELLDEQYNVVCQDFRLICQNSELSLFLNSVLSKIKGSWAKCVSDVHSLTAIIILHLQGTRYFSRIYSMPMEVQTGHLSRDLQPHDVKDAVCFVSQSRTIGGTGGGDPSFAGRIRRRPRTFKRRRPVVTDGTKRSINTILVDPWCAARFRDAPPRPPPAPLAPPPIGEPGAVSSTRRRRRRRVPLACWVYETAANILGAIRRCRRRRPVAPRDDWIFDTGAGVSGTGDLRLLRGLHDAADISSCAASGAVLGSNKCGRTSGRVKLSGVRYFPGMKANLICAGLFGTLGCETSLSQRIGCMIMKEGHVIGGGRLLANGTYSLDFLDDRLLGSVCPYCPP